MDRSTVPPSGTAESGSTVPAAIERVAALGRGVARVDGRVLLVRRGVPGEEVLAVIERSHANYALARVEEVVRPAPERIEPPCPQFGHCGGCDWQHVSATAQTAYKQAVFSEQLERISRLMPPPWHVEPAVAPLEYRERLEFVPVLAAGRWRPGFHAERHATPVPIDRCWLAPAAYTQLAQAVLDGLSAQGALPASLGGDSAAGPAGGLRRLTVQSTLADDGHDDLTVLLQLKPGAGEKPRALARRFAEALEAAWPPVTAQSPRAVGAALLMTGGENRGGRRKPRLEVLWGPRLLVKQVGGRRLLVPLGGFFQVNSMMAGVLAGHVNAQVKARLAPQGHPEEAPLLFDLYGGSGLFALPLAEAGFRVVCVDGNREAVAAGAEGARRAGLPNLAFQRRNLENPGALRVLADRWGAPAAVICDPPRRGLAAPLCSALTEEGPPVLVYVSCDGGTFARDAARLAGSYRLAHLRGFDLFPQTHHLEVVGVFERLD